MSHYIIPAPAASNYNQVWDDVRAFISRYADVPITAGDVPNSFFDRDVFVMPAEVQVLTHKKRAITVVPTDDTDYELLLTLTEIRIGIECAPRLPQQVRRMMLGESGEYSEVKMTEFINFLENTYIRTINPATDIPDTPDSPTGTDSLTTPVVYLVR